MYALYSNVIQGNDLDVTRGKDKNTLDGMPNTPQRGFVYHIGLKILLPNFWALTVPA
jgi:hypothetical protein